MKEGLYGFKVASLTGEEVDLNQYKGKVVLVVNTASKCGLTPQYKGLEAMYQKYKDQGFVILGFPSNQFLEQEPGTSEEIAAFCEKNYGVSFPMFEKIEVRGENAHPLYKMLTEEKPFLGFDDSESGQKFKGFISEKFPEIYEGNGIKWNFTKFIIDRNGKVVKRIEPNVAPEDFEDEIKGML
ncbi:redoxin domain-containing protein [Labilibaculum sp. 44]|uniref:Glutathione peroxidase n=1 Tax=Labilibaculum euxinus TaxID=2686357 RepID=A0A7M4D2S4_9BACT|nr:glutathione peroxidase [Labilibaculum euxinus]MUP36953.1 redoxin domain-containing protein [Labilibaculum euxinus]MVB06158.1 redoxin domain-containing protein [Labilibaculum euxinus]